MANTINLDFDSILEIALKGVRRSSVFMGLGVNAAMDPNNNSYQLTDTSQIQLVSDDVPQETVEHFKTEFKIWIEACALREAIEAFALFLDETHRACSIIFAVKDRTPMDQFAEKQGKFAKQGVPNKLNNLEQRYKVTSAHKDNLVQIYRARNCLAHRNGRVGPEDIKDKEQFTVAWQGLDLFVEEPDGTKSDLYQIPEGGLLLENGGVVKAQLVERSRSFSSGEILSLSSRDLAEICWFLTNEARAITKTALEYAEENGVELKHADQKEV